MWRSPGRSLDTGMTLATQPIVASSSVAKNSGARLESNSRQVVPLARLGPSTQYTLLTLAKGKTMNSIIYIIGLVVVIIAVLSFFGLR